MKRILVVLLCLLSLIPCHAAEWYPGIIHLHTQFSDGVAPPSVVATATAAAGAKFIIITDHYDLIGEPMKGAKPLALSLGALALNHGWPSGFANYCNQVSGLTRDGQFVAIPGAEIGARWNPEPGNEASAHTLALGVIRELDSQLMDQYCEKLGKQQDVINKIRQWGMLPVAAHPSLLVDGQSGDLSYTGRIDYRYDKRPADQAPGGRVQYQGLAGVEMWDSKTDGQRQEDLDFYLRLIREGYRPFVVSGSDYHGYKPWETATFGRKTWVYADSLTTNGILKAIGEGRTYAAQYGARLTQISPLLGEKTTMPRAVIKATVAFDSPTGSGKEFVVYRDGNLVESSRQTQPAGKTSYDYYWTDTDGSLGEHSYVLRVGEVVVTSPMWVGVTTEPTRRVAFIRDGNVWLTDLSGRDPRRLTTSGDCSSPSWSPDGRRLVYVRSTAYRKGSLWILDVDAGAATVLTRQVSEYVAPCWSPDGQWIACFDHDAQQPETEYHASRLIKISLVTKTATVLKKGIWGAADIAWSPTSSQIAYSCGTEGGASISTLSASDGQAIRDDLYSIWFETPDVWISSLNWLVDGRIIFVEGAFGSEGDDDAWLGNLQILQVKLDGSDVRYFIETDDCWAFELSVTDPGCGVLKCGSALWVLQGDRLTKLVEDVEEPALGPGVAE